MYCFQAVGYNSVEAEEDWDAATHGEDMGKLEALFLDKNRKMEHELTKVKASVLCLLSGCAFTASHISGVETQNI